MNNNENAKKGLTKKQSITIISVLGALLIVLALLNTLDFDAIFEKIFKKDSETPEYNYFFYDPDYDTDILEDSEYLALDRTISYSEGPITYRDADLDNFFGTSVLKDYFETLINGDAKGYAALFTDEYKVANVIPQKFPQQRIYNITIERSTEPYVFEETDLDGKYTGITRYVYTVNYFIQYNTGTVRNDIDSSSTRPLIIEVYETPAGVQKINAIVIGKS